MKNSLLFLASLAFMTNIISAQKIGLFEKSVDVGDPQLKGLTAYDKDEQSYTISGAGYNIWLERDEFHYLCNQIEGDFILTAEFEFIGDGVNAHRKAGWMARRSLDDDAAHFSAAVHGDGLVAAQWRAERGERMEPGTNSTRAPKTHYSVLQLERNRNRLIFRAAHPGEPLQEIASKTMDLLQGPVYAGLFICSHTTDVVEKVRVWNVRMDSPVGDDYDHRKQPWLGSRLETLNIFTREREVIWEKDSRFEAPNWMPDGERLLFNMGGSIYTISLEGGDPEILDTGKVKRNNNDHGISFDGKKLALSSHTKDPDGSAGSAIYVVPLEGGDPVRVTENKPSYWHGWSPNNRDVVYVAKRNPDDPFNIFQADIDTKKETQLTFYDSAHVDGPEYSPDGEWIYYNGSRTGTMQIWRMRPDGSHKEQLTFDEYNDWFPHVSPDGQWIVMISFPDNIDPDSHPPFKRVMLRLLPLNRPGGPKVIATLYGGQGSINVPSWSPDSRYIAFVSNTKGLQMVSDDN